MRIVLRNKKFTKYKCFDTDNIKSVEELIEKIDEEAQKEDFDFMINYYK